MGKTILACFIVLMSTHSTATDQINTNKIIRQCSGVTEVAKIAVEARQKGVPASSMYKALINQDETIQELLKVVLDTAYRTPLASTKEERDIIVLEYTNQFFSDCMKILSKENDE
ncbi:hypothetical protein [Acinetobacter ursingii]|uniref:hypothetical protein n=1 Tax=Acinetobacter ursingii TaxID=108980 RepID=UPI0032B504D3